MKRSGDCRRRLIGGEGKEVPRKRGVKLLEARVVALGVEMVAEDPVAQVPVEHRAPGSQGPRGQAVKAEGLQGDRGIQLGKGLKRENKCSSNRISK